LRSWWARLELRWIFAMARTPQVLRVQRVGALYEHIVKKMKAERSIDGNFASAAQYFPIQASPSEAWASAGVSRHMIVERISNHREAISALMKIMAQGEGPLNDANSHFVRFRRVLRFMRFGRYSHDFHSLEPGTQAGMSPVSSPTPVSRALAQLLDVRYQLLLVRLYQIFAPNPDAARRIRIGCSLREMRFVIAPLTDAIRTAAAAGGGCPAMFTLPAYFDPHTRPEQQSRQASLLRDTETLIKELQVLMPSSGTLGGVAATIHDLEGVLATVS
jgi:hypothetical protein